MKKHSTMLLVALGALAPSLAQAEAGRTLVGVVPTGQMHVHLHAPLVSDVDKTTPIVGGRVELTEGPGSDEFGKTFVLTRATLRFGDLDIDTSLASGHMRTIGADLAHSVTLVGSPVSPGVFSFSVSPQEITFHEAATVDGQPSEGYDRPTQDVVGSIDMNAGVFHATIVLPRHHDIDCPVIGCGSVDGTLTIDLTAAFSGDVDGDGVPDFRDNCVRYANPSQEPVPVPMVTAPPDLELSNCGASPIGTATATDVCNAWPTTVTNNAPSTYRQGTTPVSWYGSVAGHGGTTVVQNVTVVDRTPPTFVGAAPPITFPACRSTHRELSLPVEIHDDCDGGAQFLTNNAPERIGAGQTVVVTWTATDSSGNSATLDQQVTGGPDTTPPKFVEAPEPVTTNGCVAPVLRQPWVSDDCGHYVLTSDAPATFPIGQTTVTWTATDDASNSATATQLVTMPPPPNPFPSTPLPTFTTDVCMAVNLPSPNLHSMCGSPLHLSNDAPAPTRFPQGDTLVTWTVTDDAGRRVTDTQLVRVTPDQTPPQFVEVPLPPVTTEICAPPQLTRPAVTDSCGVATVTNDAPATFPLGQTTVTWTARDAAGNAATDTQLVTVTPDHTPPQFLVNGVPVQGGGLTTIMTSYGVQPVLAPPDVADNCGGQVTVTNNATGVVFEPGTTEITWTATDQAGNAATISQWVFMSERPGWPGDGPGGPAGGGPGEN